jgi:hypothetical protein
MSSLEDVVEVGSALLSRRVRRTVGMVIAICLLLWFYLPYSVFTAPIRTVGCAAVDRVAKDVTDSVDELADRFLPATTVSTAPGSNAGQPPVVGPARYPVQPSTGLPGC